MNDLTLKEATLMIKEAEDTIMRILDKLATNFIDWFFTLLFNWLMETE